jgi:hypothetical protein
VRFRRTEFISVAAAAVLQVVPFTAGSAQEPRPLPRAESVPIELATALVSSGGLGGEPQILVGAIPGWVTNRIYVPPSARVLGSAFIGTSVVAVLNVTDEPEAIIATLKRELGTRGWKAPPTPNSSFGGFRPAPVADAMLTRFTFCQEQQYLSGTAARRQGLYTEVIVRLSTFSGNFTVCNPPQVSSGAFRNPYPTLFNPAGAIDARSMGDCASTITGPNSTSTLLRTAVAPEAILDHYGRQLADSGWKDASDKASVVARSWTRTDSTGAPVELTLSVATSARDASCRDINLQVRTLRKP